MQTRPRASFAAVLSGLLATAVFLFPQTVEAQTGSIRGSVIDQISLEPLVGAQVSLQGTGIGQMTNASGQFLLLNVPAGQATVRVQFIGYGAETSTVQVSSGQVATLDFRLRTRAIDMDAIVVTGTGAPTERRQLGQTIASVSSEQFANAPITSVADALQGRVAGLTGQSMGETGSAPVLLLRGTASLSQRNEPLIYVDGIRMDNTPARVSGTVTNRLADINPSDIERIEIIKGAAAATLFGTEASSGVIQIFTKRGRAQEAAFSFQVDQQLIHMPHSMWPVNAQWSDVAGAVVYDKPAEAFVDMGNHQNYSLSVRGGTAGIQYFVSGRVMDENGPMPNNAMANASLRSAFDFTHGERLRSSVDLSWVNSTLDAPQPDWSSQASDFLLSQPARGTPEFPHGRSACRCFDIADLLQFNFQSNAKNAVLSGSLSYDVTDDILATVRLGHNHVSRRDVAFRPEGITPVGEYLSAGFRRVGNVRTNASTVDASITWNAAVTSRIGSNLTVGGQSFWEGRIQEQVSVQDFASPTLRTLRGGANVTSVDEYQEDVINAGLFAQQQIALDDRLFLTVGVRMDGNSAFGEDFGLTTFPKAGLSWVLSEHSFWNVPGVEDFRLRGAIGTAGLQPGAFDAQRTWRPDVFAGGRPMVSPLNLGNTSLKPERSTEREVAIEAGLFAGRVGIEAIYFNQLTTDALLPQSATPSGGFTGTQLINIGEMQSQGVELLGNVMVVEKATFGWALNASYTWIDQEVTDMGGVPDYRVAGGRRYSWIAEGHRPGVIIAPIQDPDNPYRLTRPAADLTTLAQVQANLLRNPDGSEQWVVLGNSLPTWTANLGNTFRFGQNLSLRALFVSAGGFLMSNETELIRGSGGLINPFTAEKQAVLRTASSTAEERLAVADEYGRRHPSVVSSWMEKGDYLKLNEISLTWQVPQRLIGGLGVGATSLSVGGRNLVTWTKYSGILDPGASRAAFGSNSPFLQNIDYISTPVPRRYSLTIQTTW